MNNRDHILPNVKASLFGKSSRDKAKALIEDILYVYPMANGQKQMLSIQGFYLDAFVIFTNTDNSAQVQESHMFCKKVKLNAFSVGSIFIMKIKRLQGLAVDDDAIPSLQNRVKGTKH